MEIEIKNTNNEVVSSFYIPVVIEPTSKENVNSDNTPNYFEEFAEKIEEFEAESNQMMEDIKNDYEETVEPVLALETRVETNENNIASNTAAILNNSSEIEQNANDITDVKSNTYSKTQTDNLIQQVKESVYHFDGFVSLEQPVNAVVGDKWINSDTMPTEFPETGVKVYDGTTWNNDVDYTSQNFDSWLDIDDGHIYFWFANKWNLFNQDLDMSGIYSRIEALEDEAIDYDIIDEWE